MDATITAAAARDLVLVEGARPLQASSLWALQRAFYDRVHVRAWADSIVPSFVTCNAFIAQSYARVILGFIRDWFLLHAAREGDPSAPVYIVEIGGGHGKLAFLIIRELLALRDQWPDPFAVRPPFVYVLTDCAASSVEFWEGHERLAPLVEQGVLALAVWDAERDAEIRLRPARSNCDGGGDGAVLPDPAVVLLSPARPTANPVVCIANYVFDSLAQEAWRVVGGQLQEGRVMLYSDRAQALPLPADADPADALRRIKCVWDWGSPRASSDGGAGAANSSGSGSGSSSAAQAAPLKQQLLQPHADATLSLVLQAYAARLGTGSMLLPVGGLAAIRRLSALAVGGRCFALVGDKAYAQEEELAGLRDPHVASHGSVSFMANLHAARLAVLAGGGMSLHTPYLEGFKVAALLLGGLQHVHRGRSGDGTELAAALRSRGTAAQPLPVTPAELLAAADTTLPPGALASLPDTLLAWADAMDTFGPDNFVALQRCARDESKGEAASLRLALAVVRLAAWDADVFLKFKTNIIDRSPTASDKLAADMALDVAAVAERYFPLQAAKDVSFELGRVCMGLRRYDDALTLFRASQRQCGEHHVSWYNMGICRWYMGDLGAARECFMASTRMRPDYTDASNWLVKVEAKLQGDAFTDSERAAAAAAATASQA